MRTLLSQNMVPQMEKSSSQIQTMWLLWRKMLPVTKDENVCYLAKAKVLSEVSSVLRGGERMLKSQ